jgi:hypothetical protein
MEWMVFDDLLNIAAIVLLMGLGIGVFLLIALLYLGTLGILEETHDR